MKLLSACLQQIEKSDRHTITFADKGGGHMSTEQYNKAQAHKTNNSACDDVCCACRTHWHFIPKQIHNEFAKRMVFLLLIHWFEYSHRAHTMHMQTNAYTNAGNRRFFLIMEFWLMTLIASAESESNESFKVLRICLRCLYMPILLAITLIVISERFCLHKQYALIRTHAVKFSFLFWSLFVSGCLLKSKRQQAAAIDARH